MRDLAFTSDSPQSIKLGDSNDVLSLRVTELDQPVDLSKVSSITVKIGNTSGYLTEINVDVSSLLHPTDGRIDFAIDSKISNELPAGQYLLEVWINDAQGNTTIYPDTSYPSVIGFSIKKNIMAATSTVITTLTLADFETKFDDMQNDLQNKVASGYFKGDKGDTGPTGTVDNAGLISAPAFQSLQAQVNNSAVGTNLLTGTSSGYKTIPDSVTIYAGGIVYMPSSADITNIGGQTITIRTYIKNTTAIPVALKLYFNKQFFNGNNVDANSEGYSTITATLPLTSSSGVDISIRGNGATSGVQYKEFKLEKGSVATDWCPNPSEILTQSDYDKIQAAIVALGGSLS